MKAKILLLLISFALFQAFAWNNTSYFAKLENTVPVLQHQAALKSLISTSADVHSDDSLLSRLKKKVNHYHKALPQEKIYIQLDKPIYKPGETIWGSIYVRDANTLNESKASKVVYVELVNPKGQVEKKLILELKEGKAALLFDLPYDQTGGIFTLKAYTNWMKNFGEEGVFSKQLLIQNVISPELILKMEFERKAYGPGDTVTAKFEAMDLGNNKITNSEVNFKVNLNGVEYISQKAMTDSAGKALIQFQLPDDLQSNDGLLNVVVSAGKSESIARSIPIVLNQIDLQFLPEGGELVENIESKIAFKALNELGKPADIEGALYDELGYEILKFKSFHQGMGCFYFKPLPGKSYTARISRPQKVNQTYILPKALQKGSVMRVDTLIDQKIRIQVQSSTPQKFYLIAQQRGNVFFGTDFQSSNGINTFEIPVDTLQAGIVQISLMDERMKEIAERLLFVNAHKKVYLTLQTDKKEYQPHEKVSLTVQARDEKQEPVSFDFSLSVANERDYNNADDKQDNILSSLLMSSDLKGKIEEPYFYFDEKESKAPYALDLVMMTHGWRRYNWDKVLQEEYYIQYFPEISNNMVSGQILNIRTGRPVEAEVLLLLSGANGKMEKIITQKDGKFLFLNIPAVGDVKLYAKSTKEKEKNLSILPDNAVLSNYPEYRYISSPNYVLIGAKKEANDSNKEIEIKTGEVLDINLNEGTTELTDVVVTASGMETERSTLAYSVSSSEMRNSGDLIDNSVNAILRGKAAGVMITQNNGVSNDDTQIMIRGISSVATGSGPLIVLDGIPMSEGFNSGGINPQDVYDIEVIQASRAMALYGSRASQGAVLLNIRDEVMKEYNYNDYYGYTPRKIKPEYKGLLLINQKKANTIKSFYSPVFSEKENKNDNERSDFRNTIYWNPTLKTDANGEAKIEFYTSEDLTSFRIVAEGINSDGKIGRAESNISNAMSVTFECNIPPYFTVEDSLLLPVFFKNKSDQALKGKMMVKAPFGIKILQDTLLDIELEPQSNKTYYISCIAVQPLKYRKLILRFESEKFNNTLTQQITIHPKGFPTQLSYSGNQKEAEFSFTIPKYLEGSLEAQFSIFPSLMNEFLAGLEGILRQPHGCFEQVSSSTYPNILALQLLRESGKANPEIEKKAIAYIKDGYKRLIGYEVQGGGFDWFGQKPANIGLTAYGVLEFQEMRNVYAEVDQKMIDRTIDWLLKCKDGKGGFQNPDGADHHYQQEIVNAYTVYALAQTPSKNEILQEFEAAYKEALLSKDQYRMALMTNASFQLGYTQKGMDMMGYLTEIIKKKGLDGLDCSSTMVGAYGNSGKIEIASLLGITMLKNKIKDDEFFNSVNFWIFGNRNYNGMFGSTQSTIMAMQYLSEYSKNATQNLEEAKYSVFLDNQLLFQNSFSENSLGGDLKNSLEEKVHQGTQSMKIIFEDHFVPYSLSLKWNSYTPNSSKDCKVDISTALSSSSVKINETVRLSTYLSNKTDENLPMTMALVAIPSGLSAQPWQLKELQEKGVFDFYEIKDNYLVFYYRGMTPNEMKTINLDLKAEMPGVFQATASSAYLYYTDEFKVWKEGEKIRIVM